MDEISVHKPLLSSHYAEPSYSKNKPLILSLAKWILETVIWVVFILWVAFLFLYPTDYVNGLVRKWTEVSNDTVFGTAGLH